MKNTLTKFVNAYVVALLVVFPLILHNSYYDIQEAKIYMYLYSTYACLLFIFLTFASYLIGNKHQERENFKKAFRISQIKKHLMKSDIFALVFLLVVILSTFTSEWLYESFWGNAGRYQGGFMWFWYMISYFIISRWYVPRQWHLDAMMGAALIVCGWAVLDYFSMSPLGIGYERLFSSTFGNINVLAAAEGMYFAAAAALFTGSSLGSKKDNIRSLYYLICVLVVFMGLECGRTANALLSLIVVVCFMPFFAFRTREGIIRYLIMLILILLGMVIIGILTAAFPDKACTSEFWGEIGTIGNKLYKKLAVLMIVLAGFAAVLYVFFKNGEKKLSAQMLQKDENGVSQADRKFSKPLRIVWGILGIIAFCAVTSILIDANTGGHPELYAPYSRVLIFDEKWGTDRGYAWRLAMKYFKDFPIGKKLIGSGPETFPVYVLINDLNANLRKYNLNYDSIHNEWLQHLFEEGIVGFLAYYGMNISAVIAGFRTVNEKIVNGKNKETKENRKLIMAVFAFATIAYLVQSSVNVSVPIVLPLAMLTMSAAAGAARIEE